MLPACTAVEALRKSAAAAAKVVKRFVMPGSLAVLIDQADRLAPRCAHSYGASGAQSRYRIRSATTPRMYSDVLIAVAYRLPQQPPPPWAERLAQFGAQPVQIAMAG